MLFGMILHLIWRDVPDMFCGIVELENLVLIKIVFLVMLVISTMPIVV